MTAAPAIPPPRAIERRFALGLGLTNACNLSCGFCYRDPTRVDRLSLDQVRAVLDRLPVRSVNLGTGENGMHPDFKPMLDLLRGEPIKLTITSNGQSRWCERWRDCRRGVAAAASPPYASPRALPCSPASTGRAPARRSTC